MREIHPEPFRRHPVLRRNGAQDLTEASLERHARGAVGLELRPERVERLGVDCVDLDDFLRGLAREGERRGEKEGDEDEAPHYLAVQPVLPVPLVLT